MLVIKLKFKYDKIILDIQIHITYILFNLQNAFFKNRFINTLKLVNFTTSIF